MLRIRSAALRICSSASRRAVVSSTQEAWLKAQQPRFLLYPAQKSCVEKALKFLPKLKAALKAAADKAEADTDEDEKEAPEPIF